MDRPMRAYGPTAYELVLADYLAGLGLALIGLAVACAIVPSTLLPVAGATGGLLAGLAAGAGLCLAQAGGGIRQNRAALDLGFALLAATGLAWTAWAIVDAGPVPIVAGVALLAMSVPVVVLRRFAVRARFAPRYLSPRGLETMIAVAETMIDGDGREAIHPIDVAIRVDHLLDEGRPEVAGGEIKMVMFIVEWLLPLAIARPMPFSTLGSTARRRAVERVIGAGGPFRDIARTLKVLSCVGYYGNPETMRALGYVPFDERERSTGIDQAPLRHPDPFLDLREDVGRP
jgi:hypothetical protein